MNTSIFALLAEAPSAVGAGPAAKAGTTDGEPSFEGMMNAMLEEGGEGKAQSGAVVPTQAPPQVRAVPEESEPPAEEPTAQPELSLELLDQLKGLLEVPVEVCPTGAPVAGTGAELPVIEPEMWFAPDRVRPDAVIKTQVSLPAVEVSTGGTEQVQTDPPPQMPQLQLVSLPVKSDGAGGSETPLAEVLTRSTGKQWQPVERVPAPQQTAPQVDMEEPSETVPSQTNDAGTRGALPPAAKPETDVRVPEPSVVKEAQDRDSAPVGKQAVISVSGEQTSRVTPPQQHAPAENSRQPAAGLNLPTPSPVGVSTSEASTEAAQNPTPSATVVVDVVPETAGTEAETREGSDASRRSEAKGSMEPQPNSWSPERAQTQKPFSPAETQRADVGHFVDRVVRFVQTMTGRDQSSVEMRLNPPELGSLRLSMIVKDGELRMAMQTSTEEARQVIVQNLGQLRQTLVQQGYEVGQLDVSLAQSFAERQMFRDDPRLERGGGQGLGASSETDAAGQDSIRLVSIYGGRYLDLVA